MTRTWNTGLDSVRWLALVLAAFAFLLSPGFVNAEEPGAKSDVTLVVLGIAQDAGFPQAGCKKKCCEAAWKDASLRRMVSCIGLIDHSTGQRWVLDCSPNFPDQLNLLNSVARELELETNSADGDAKSVSKPVIDGIFLTHAHIGHYTGLMHLGREVMGAAQVPVYGMPRMNSFLKTNGPWSQLVKLDNIQLKPLENGKTVTLRQGLSITPILVPHRDEFSETVGFLIKGPTKTALYLPDIDKWSKWDRSIEKLIKQVDVAYLDGTFLANGEIPGRDMSMIPHPFIAESINLFAPLDETERSKVRFIHLNHTNPAILPESPARRTIKRAGLDVAKQGERITL